MTWMKSALPCTNLFVHTEAQEQFASSSTMGSKRKAAEMNVGANNVAQLQEDVNTQVGSHQLGWVGPNVLRNCADVSKY